MIPLDLQYNIFFQNLGLWLLPVMKLFSSLGTENFYILLFPLIYWCIDPALGLRLGIALLSTTSINSILKLTFHSPRPYWVDSRVIAFTHEPSFGFPSGHSQMAASVWGTLGSYVRKPWAIFTAVFFILMIGISRLYLGVHFSVDVLGGWAIGLLVVILINFLDKPVSNWISKNGNLIIFFIGAGIGVFLLAAGLFIRQNLQDWQVPSDWQIRITNTGNEIDPIRLKDIFSSVGTWIGFIGGACWLRSKESEIGKFLVHGVAVQKFWRYAVGIAGILFLWAGLGLIFPGDESSIGLILRLLRYGLVGGWISGLAPYIFIKTRLVSPNR